MRELTFTVCRVRFTRRAALVACSVAALAVSFVGVRRVRLEDCVECATTRSVDEFGFQLSTWNWTLHRSETPIRPSATFKLVGGDEGGHRHAWHAMHEVVQTAWSNQKCWILVATNPLGGILEGQEGAGAALEDCIRRGELSERDVMMALAHTTAPTGPPDHQAEAAFTAVVAALERMGVAPSDSVPHELR